MKHVLEVVSTRSGRRIAVPRTLTHRAAHQSFLGDVVFQFHDPHCLRLGIHQTKILEQGDMQLRISKVSNLKQSEEQVLFQLQISHSVVAFCPVLEGRTNPSEGVFEGFFNDS
jgi:hypothetical protein